MKKGVNFKGAETTCVEKVSVTKNDLDWKTICYLMLPENLSPYENVLAGLFIK